MGGDSMKHYRVVVFGGLKPGVCGAHNGFGTATNT